MRKIEQDQSSFSSFNKLNVAFIAENSKDVECSSVSSAHDRESISSISRRASNSFNGSPVLQLSNMQEWSNDTPDIFGKKNTPNFTDYRKRQTRSSIIQLVLQQNNNEEEQQIEKISKCTKKRIGDKNKIITIVPAANFNQYDLRSKGKISTPNGIPNSSNENQSSGSQQLRQMVAEISSKKIGQKSTRNE